MASRAGRGRDSTQEAWLCRDCHGHPRTGEVLSRCAHGSKGTVGLIHVHLVPMCVPGLGRGGDSEPQGRQEEQGGVGRNSQVTLGSKQESEAGWQDGSEVQVPGPTTESRG